jgi:hypothetical protein
VIRHGIEDWVSGGTGALSPLAALNLACWGWKVTLPPVVNASAWPVIGPTLETVTSNGWLGETATWPDALHFGRDHGCTAIVADDLASSTVDGRVLLIGAG